MIVGWFPIAVGELLYGETDDFSRLEEIADSSARIVTGALFQLLGAVVLIPAILGLVYLAHRRARLLTAIGGALSIPLPVAVGAFAQLHLLVLESADPDLDREAMERFAENFQLFGPWSIPTLLLGMTFGLPLLVVAMWRTGIVSYVPIVLVVAGVFLHLGIERQWAEVTSHLLFATGLALVGVAVLRLDPSQWAAAARSMSFDEATNRYPAGGR